LLIIAIAFIYHAPVLNVRHLLEAVAVDIPHFFISDNIILSHAYNIMDLEEAAKFIEKMAKTESKFNASDFIEFGVEEAESIAAIDGSSMKILDAGNFFVFLVRTGYVIVKGGEIKKKVFEPSIEIVEEESKIDEIREAMEMELAGKLNAELILIDGVPKELKDNMVGISKKSGLKYGSVPLLYLIKKYGDILLPAKRWFYKINETTYAAKFHPYARFAFRVDATGEVKEKLEKIASLCNEIGNIGYPYPLAIAHRIVEIKKEEADYIKNRIRENAGMSYEDWENIFYDYHEYMV
jgi:hypothetical protein